MKKLIKHKTFSADRAGSGKINLATGALDFMHQSANSGILPMGIAHIYKSQNTNQDSPYGKGFKLNLQQTLSHREGDETKWKYIDGQGNQHKFKEKYYYLNESNKKEFIAGLKPGNIRINQDGRLFEIATEREVFAEIKSKSGLKLHTQLKNFVGSEKIETRHEELAQVEEEIEALKRSRDELLFSISETENINQVAESMTEHVILRLPQSTFAEKQRKYLLLKKKYEQIVEKDNYQQAWHIDDYGYAIEDTGYGYKDEEGKMIERMSAHITSENIRKTQSGEEKIEGYGEKLLKQFNAQQSFNTRLERLKQKLEEITASFSEERSLNDLTRINTMLEQKQAAREQLLQQLPVNYVENNGIILGFNRLDQGGKLVSIFDNHDNQIAIIYEDGKIKRVMGNEDKEITLDYNHTNGKLVSITDCENRKTGFEYNGDHLQNIIHPNGEKSTFAYDAQNRLNEMISPSGIGAKLAYDGSGMINSIAQKTYTKNISSNGIQAFSLTTDEVEFKEESLFQIAYNSADRVTTVESRGFKEIYHFDEENEITAECHLVSRGTDFVPSKIALYDFSKDEHELLIERKRPLLLTETEADYIIGMFKTNTNPWTPESTEASYPSADYEWTLFQLEGYRKVVEHNSAAIKTQEDGQQLTTVRKEFEYSSSDNLAQETVFETKTTLSQNSNPVVEENQYVTQYEYNKQGSQIRAFHSDGTITETVYNTNGSIEKSFTYHKSDSSAKFYQEETEEESPIVFGADVHTNEVTSMVGVAGGDANKTLYAHTAEHLTKLTGGNTNVEYTYDEWGRKKSIILNGEEYVTFEYLNDETVIAKYFNGEKDDNGNNMVGDQYKTITDSFGKVLTVHRKNAKYNFWAEVIRNEYDSEDRLKKVFDRVTQEETRFDYNPEGNVTLTKQGAVEIIPYANLDGDIQKLTYRIGNKEQVYTKIIENKEVKSLILPTGDKIDTFKDSFGRLSKLESPVITEEFGYLQKGDHASQLVNKITQKVDGKINRLRYVYDVNGNVSEERDGYNNLQARYEYDELNRLIKENETEFAYDNNGNILYKKNDENIIDYKYDGDKLLSFNGEGCGEYDALGNPKIYRDKNLEWDFRNLIKFGNIEFKYNASNFRKKKVQGNNRSEYFWAVDKLIAEKRTKSTCDLEVGGYVYQGGHHIYADEKFIEYIYGVDGMTGFKVDDVLYWFAKNLQGDVIAIYDNESNCVAKYKYDAFGNCEIVSSIDGIAEFNTIRYRSYYFDKETGLYYLQTRYYDPETGRFINADAIDILDEAQHFINGLNLYAYCGNNPIMRTDESGEKWWKWLVGGVVLIALAAATVLTAGATLAVGSLVGAGVSAAIGVGVAAITGSDLADAFMWGSITGSIAGGLSAGLSTSTIVGSKLATAGLQVVGNGLISSSITSIQGLITGKGSSKDVAISALFGAIGGATGYMLAGTVWSTRIRSALVALGLGLAEGSAIVLESRQKDSFWDIIRMIFSGKPKLNPVF